MQDPVVIIGGGAAGILAAVGAARSGAEVFLLEKNDALGRKMLLTGNGRCNLTNSTDIESLVENIPGNGRFLYTAFNAFSSEDTVRFVNELGLPTKIEPGGRVFPASGGARQVIDLLGKYLKHLNVKVELRQKVTGLVRGQNSVSGVKAGGHTWPASAVVVCTGGVSYPATGSTGDGYQWAREMGHHVIPFFPALVPLVAIEEWVPLLQGLSFVNIVVSAWGEDRLLGRSSGDLVFTHFGVSGPAILNLSRDVSYFLTHHTGPVRLVLDFKPGQTVEQLEEHIQENLDQASRRELKNALGDLLPHKLLPIFMHILEVAPELPAHQVTREQRLQMAGFLKSWPLTVTGTRPLPEAMVTAGGVSVKEVNPKTMESKIVPGLYFAGEVLDVDGFTGGFNLQAAFSTGYIAGTAAGKRIRELDIDLSIFKA